MTIKDATFYANNREHFNTNSNPNDASMILGCDLLINLKKWHMTPCSHKLEAAKAVYYYVYI